MFINRPRKKLLFLFLFSTCYLKSAEKDLKQSHDSLEQVELKHSGDCVFKHRGETYTPQDITTLEYHSAPFDPKIFPKQELLKDVTSLYMATFPHKLDFRLIYQIATLKKNDKSIACSLGEYGPKYYTSTEIQYPLVEDVLLPKYWHQALAQKYAERGMK